MAIRTALVSLALALSAGCATKVSIASHPPGAEVLLEVEGEGLPHLLGKTPLTTSHEALSGVAGSAPKRLSIRQKGFRSHQLLVPEDGSDLAVSIALTPDAANIEAINQSIRLVLQGQRLLLQRRFDETLRIALELRRISDNIASAHELEGSVYYLTDRIREARFAWSRVLELEPDNDEARGMLKLVEARLGPGR